MTDFLGCKLVDNVEDMALVCAAVTRELDLFTDGRKNWSDGPVKKLYSQEDYIHTILHLADVVSKSQGPGSHRVSTGRIMVCGMAPHMTGGYGNPRWKDVYFHVGSTANWPNEKGPLLF